MEKHSLTNSSKCVKCVSFNTMPPVQLMAELPTEPVIPVRPLSSCVIEFAGTSTIESKLQKTKKIYIAMLVGMNAKAVRMKLVSGLTKEDGISALTRFISRRGISIKIFIDNRSNLVGARNDFIKLNILLDESNKENLSILSVNEAGSGSRSLLELHTSVESRKRQ